MGTALANFGFQQANNVAGGIIGMAMGNYNDRRQRDQQEKLQRIQMEGQKEMTAYNYAKQLQMWKETNYSAQIEQLKKAGLNPGLIYGTSGGGGTTTGSATGNVTGGTAPSGGGEIQAAMGMGIQSALLEAQRKNIEANTEKTKAETANVPLTGEQTKASTALTKVQTQIASVEASIKGRSEEATVRAIDAAAEKVMHEAVIARNQENISEQTWLTEVQKATAELIGIGINNTLHEQQTAESKQRIKTMATELLQKARGLDQKDLEIAIRQFEANLKQEMPGIGQVTGRIVNNMINEYLHATRGILGNKEPQKPIK